MDFVQYKMESSIKPLYLVASKKGLSGVYFDKQPSPVLKTLDRRNQQERILDDARVQLKEYFSGRRKAFDLPFDLKGTAFQKRVWQELFKIPFGVTVSYKDIARRIKNPNAMRAVGSANGRNPVCIVIPCHRVIAADGSLGGYTSGLSIKRKLLALEGCSYK